MGSEMCIRDRDQIDHDLYQMHQIDHDLDQIDQIDRDLDQIDHDLNHLVPNLPLRDVVRNLYNTDPPQETWS